MSSRPDRIAGVVVALVVVLVVAGLLTGIVPRAARGALYGSGLWSDSRSASIDPNLGNDPEAAAKAPPPVLSASTTEADISAESLAKRVKAVDTSGVGGTLSAFVAEADGRKVYSAGGDRARIPASTMKILTTATALTLLGAQHRFETTVTRPSAKQVVLVGGGDPYLCSRKACAPQSAKLQTLAAQTARELKLADSVSVSLGYDDSLFSGPAWNPAWPAGYRDQVTPTSALWVNEGRISGVSPGARETEPAKTAAEEFAAMLKKAGIKVAKVAPVASPEDAEEIAAVQSQPLSVITEEILLRSDNDAAEVLLRQAGVAGSGAGSIKAGQKVVRDTVAELSANAKAGEARNGGKSKGVKVVDGSGLARTNTVPAELLVDLVRLGIDPQTPELRPLATGLPVAGVSGSLTYRFVSTSTDPARGMVRAKTGTLRKTHALAGYVQTADGATLAFAFLVNDAKNDYAARVWLDRVTAAIAGCGC